LIKKIHILSFLCSSLIFFYLTRFILWLSYNIIYEVLYSDLLLIDKIGILFIYLIAVGFLELFGIALIFYSITKLLNLDLCEGGIKFES